MNQNVPQAQPCPGNYDGLLRPQHTPGEVRWLAVDEEYCMGVLPCAVCGQVLGQVVGLVNVIDPISGQVVIENGQPLTVVRQRRQRTLITSREGGV